MYRLDVEPHLVIGSFIIGIIAAVWDLKYRKIPNWLTFPGMVLGIGLHFMGNAREWYFSLTGILAGFAILFIPFACGGIGAGDVKLLMAIGAFLGAGNIIRIGLYGGIAGGLLSLIALIFKYGYHDTKYRLYIFFTSIWNKERRLILGSPNQTPQLAIPYGPAIFIGLMASFIGRLI